jgi:hypothetical protein
MTPPEDLFWSRTNRDRVGTIRDGSNHVLLLRDLDRLIGQGLIKRASDVREISADSREKIFTKNSLLEICTCMLPPGSGVVPSFGGTLSFLFTTNLTSFNKRRGQLGRLIVRKTRQFPPRSHQPAKSRYR